MAYKIFLKPSAIKDLNQLQDKEVNRLLSHIKNLSVEPRLIGIKNFQMPKDTEYDLENIGFFSKLMINYKRLIFIELNIGKMFTGDRLRL